MGAAVLDSVTQSMDQTSLREQLGAAYAAGVLEPAMRLLVETQAMLKPDAAEDLALAEILAAFSFETEAPVSLGADALEKTFSRIANEPEERGPGAAERLAARRAGALIDEILDLPAVVRDLALEAMGRGGWTFAGPGLRILPLPFKGAEIIRIEPGWGAPRHTHNGGEFTLVMTGAFHDERGRYAVGEIAYADSGVTHKPVAEAGPVCYSLAVSEGAPQFTGALGLLQKLWRN